MTQLSFVFPLNSPPQFPLPLGLDCGALTSARPPLPPRPPAMASRIGLRMQVQNRPLPSLHSAAHHSLSIAYDVTLLYSVFVVVDGVDRRKEGALVR